MPVTVCQTCGSTVRFEGIAGVCPKCAAIVRATPKAAKPPPATSGPVLPPGRKTKREIVDLQSLDLEEEGAFQPDTTGMPEGDRDPVIFYLSVGAGAVIFVFGLFYALSALLSRPHQTAIVPPPPATVVAPVAPAPLPEIAPLPPPTTGPVASTVSTAPVATRPAWMSLAPLRPVLTVKPITDESVEQAIKKGVAFLKTQFSGDTLLDPNNNDMFSGTDTLVVYSLLHAGEAVDDSDLDMSSDFMQKLLDRLKRFDMSGPFATYCRALRASALGMYARDVDAGTLLKDRDWLLKSEVGGAYTYSMPPKGTSPKWMDWDHSNSQYGVLGIWAAAQAGLTVPEKYWEDVEQHWLRVQNTDGGWGYKTDGSTLTMSCAGITTLSVTAEEQEVIASKGKKDSHPQMAAAIDRATDWLGQEDRLTNFNPYNKGYSLYGVERAALASGLRWFGSHDWYRELGAREIKEQRPDGSWAGSAMETAFRVLFLSRGRQPLLMNKLRFDGNWNDRPRDVAKLVQYASAQFEKPFAWGVADLGRNWWDWMETPFLFISTDTAPNFSDADCKKLRAYTDAGGLIFIHNEYATPEVDRFVKDLAQRTYPEYPLTPVSPDDLIFSTMFTLAAKPVLESVSNGSRTMMVYSPVDITQDWVRYKSKDKRRNPARELALNLFISTAGKSGFRNRLDSPYEEIPDFDPIGTLPIAQVSYSGNWDPEPKAYERFGRWFQKQTGLKLDVQPTKMSDLSVAEAPVALLTGNTATNFNQLNLHALHEYVAKGGVLVIDSCGGDKAFNDSIEQNLLPTAFPGLQPAELSTSHPILAGEGPCMDPLPKPHLRNYASLLVNGIPPGVRYAQFGKGAVIVSSLDITTGLLDSGTYGIVGYTPAYSQSLLKNVILWALRRS